MLKIVAWTRLARSKHTPQFLWPQILYRNKTSLLTIVVRRNKAPYYISTPQKSQCNIWVPVIKLIFCQNLSQKCQKRLRYVLTKPGEHFSQKILSTFKLVELANTKEIFARAIFFALCTENDSSRETCFFPRFCFISSYWAMIYESKVWPILLTFHSVYGLIHACIRSCQCLLVNLLVNSVELL